MNYFSLFNHHFYVCTKNLKSLFFTSTLFYLYQLPFMPRMIVRMITCRKEFHAGRRAALTEMMPDNSVVAVFAFPTRTFSNDVEYFYHQNPDMYYFSGYKEPHSILFIFKTPQTDTAGNLFSEAAVCSKRNARAEQWTGKRLGVEGAKEKLGLKEVFNGEEFQKFNIDFAKFDKIIFDRFPVDVPVSR